MIDLYVRDHHRWLSETKSKLAAEWIAEVKGCPEYRNVWLTVKMTTEFLRTQERKFAKAKKRATELNLPPPSPESTCRVDLDLNFIGPHGVPKSNKTEVQRLCRYYDRLYPALAPRLQSSTEIQPSPSIETGCAEAAFTPLSSTTSPSVKPRSLDNFRFSSSPQSSRGSTPETINSAIFSWHAVQIGLPPKTIHKSSATTVFDHNGIKISALSNGLDSSDSRMRPYAFLTPTTGIAPIPIPIPISDLTNIASHAPILHERPTGMRDLHIRSGDGGFENSSNHSFGMNAVGSRKRKLTSITTPASATSIQGQWDVSPTSKRTKKMARLAARAEELELAMAKGKEEARIRACQLRSIGSELAISVDLQTDPATLGARVERLRSQLAKLRLDGKNSWQGLSESSPPVQSSDIISLRDLRDSLIFEFPKNALLSGVGFRELNSVQRHLENFITKLEPCVALHTSNLPQIHETGNQIFSLCRIRLQLLINCYGSKKSRPYLPCRHRREQTSRFDPLREWYLSNCSDPYPTRSQKIELCQRTGLSLKKVTNWFTTARFRGMHVLYVSHE